MSDQDAKELGVIELGENFNRRLANDRAIKEELTSVRNEKWTDSAGRYEKAFFIDADDQFPYYAKKEFSDLIGEEVVYADLIQQKLEERKKSKENNPVTVLDIGGMYGESWCKLALHFQNEIKQGNIRFIVTNINLDQSNITQSFAKEMATDPYDDSMQKSFKAGKELVEWRKTDVAGLWETFKRQIDIVHEEKSMFHSSTPDIDYPLAAQLLKTDGIFISVSTDLDRDNSEYRQHHLEQIQDAYDIATKGLDTMYHRLLEGRTYPRIWSPDAGSVRYFKKSSAYPTRLQYVKE